MEITPETQEAFNEGYEAGCAVGLAAAARLVGGKMGRALWRMAMERLRDQLPSLRWMREDGLRLPASLVALMAEAARQGEEEEGAGEEWEEEEEE